MRRRDRVEDAERFGVAEMARYVQRRWALMFARRSKLTASVDRYRGLAGRSFTSRQLVDNQEAAEAASEQ